jgi:predicted transposase YbfD/YdcC
MRRTLPFAIFTRIENLTDPRVKRTQVHKLHDILVIARCAAICGANTWVDVERLGVAKRDWFARFLELPGGIPSHDTFGRGFAMLDTAAAIQAKQADFVWNVKANQPKLWERLQQAFEN